MKTTKEKIIEIIKNKGQASPSDLAKELEVSRQVIHRHLSHLMEDGKIRKIGKPPKVFYKIKPKEKRSFVNLKEKTEEVISENFLHVTPSGKILKGVDGFRAWCEERNLPLKKTAKEYIDTIKKYNSYKKEGVIDATDKLKETFEDVFVDEAYYLDFYSIKRFGKTKLGKMLLYAKQSQDKKLIKNLIEEIKPKVVNFLDQKSIDAVGFVPPTVKRKLQLMKELEEGLSFAKPKLSILKVSSSIAVPQKTLSKLEDRIENARETFVLDEDRKFETVLLVDDAMGSGSTINEIAKKIKEQDVAKRVISLCLVGSFSGFEVISEV